MITFLNSLHLYFKTMLLLHLFCTNVTCFSSGQDNKFFYPLVTLHYKSLSHQVFCATFIIFLVIRCTSCVFPIEVMFKRIHQLHIKTFRYAYLLGIETQTQTKTYIESYKKYPVSLNLLTFLSYYKKKTLKGIIEIL